MILCVERLWDFSHSLTHSGCMIYFSGAWVTFCREVARFFCKEVARFFCGEVALFSLWRARMIFFVERLHNFFFGQVV